MKKLYNLVILFLISWTNLQAQSNICQTLKTDYDKLDKKLQRLDNFKIADEDFFSLMDNPNSLDGGIPEEIANYEHRIASLQRKRTAGDSSPEITMDIQTYRTRIDLLNQRMNRGYNEASMDKDPRFLDQKKSARNVSNDQLELKVAMVQVKNKLKENNCPMPTNDDIDDIIKDDKTGINNPGDDREKPKDPGVKGNFEDEWIYSDPKHPEMVMRLKLTGSGTSTRGELNLGTTEELPAKFTIISCIETGENKLRCEYKGIMEDDQKRVDTKGSVDLILSGNTLNSTWKEHAPGTITWKPGIEMNLKTMPSARTYPWIFSRN